MSDQQMSDQQDAQVRNAQSGRLESLHSGSSPKSRLRFRRLLLAATLLAVLIAIPILIARIPATDSEEGGLTARVRRGDLVVKVVEQGLLESAENHEIKSRVRGRNAVLWVIESGSYVSQGDELIRLDSAFIEEQVDERTKYANWSKSSADRSAANVARAELAVDEYELGQFVTQLMELKNELSVAKSTLNSSQNRLKHARQMNKSEYVADRIVADLAFDVEQSRLDVGVKQTDIQVFEEFTKAEQMQTLRGNLAAARARHEANAERATADKSRRDRAVEELQYCVIRADRSGIVIHPNAAKWETAPIAEGARVHKDQVLLLMPDLEQMQVKVGVHEAVVEKVKEGLPVQVRMADRETVGTVKSVASVTRPPGWWTGNEVRYDTLIKVPAQSGMMPGMSAEVEIIIAEYSDVLLIPVAAIVTTESEAYCWVQTSAGPRRRSLKLGDSDDVFTVIEEGLSEGEDVILNPSRLTTLDGEAAVLADFPDKTPISSSSVP